MTKQEKLGASAPDSKTNTSLRLNKKTLIALKIHALEENTSVQKVIETLIDNHLKKLKKKPK